MPTNYRVPTGAQFVSASTLTSSTAAVSIALSATTAVTTFVQGFSITADHHSSAEVAVTATVTGLAGSTAGQSYVLRLTSATVPVPIVVEFSAALPASAAETAITLAVPATTNNTNNVAANIWGYQMKTS